MTVLDKLTHAGNRDPETACQLTATQGHPAACSAIPHIVMLREAVKVQLGPFLDRIQMVGHGF